MKRHESSRRFINRTATSKISESDALESRRENSRRRALISAVVGLRSNSSRAMICASRGPGGCVLPSPQSGSFLVRTKKSLTRAVPKAGQCECDLEAVLTAEMKASPLAPQGCNNDGASEHSYCHQR